MTKMTEQIKNKPFRLRKFLLACLSALVIISNLMAFHGSAEGQTFPTINPTPGVPELDSSASPKLFLPVIQRAKTPLHIINVPYFNGAIKSAETAVFWFGQVTPSDNSADVRLGYNNDFIWICVSTIDRRLWYDPAANLADMLNWDAVSLYLDLDNIGYRIDSGPVYRFDAQLTWWEARTAYQAAYLGTSSGWANTSVGFTTRTQYWGFPEPNDDKDDRAWKVEFSIPFKNLGLSGPPTQGAQWRLAVQIHDRDNAQGSPPIPDQVWPLGMKTEQTDSWEPISFGLPSYQAPPPKAPQTVSLRNGVNGITVLDGAVGGNTNCGSGLSFWTDWGNHAYPGIRDRNVQNQGNTDDWPCFSRVLSYVSTRQPASKQGDCLCNPYPTPIRSIHRFCFRSS